MIRMILQSSVLIAFETLGTHPQTAASPACFQHVQRLKFKEQATTLQRSAARIQRIWFQDISGVIQHLIHLFHVPCTMSFLDRLNASSVLCVVLILLYLSSPGLQAWGSVGKNAVYAKQILICSLLSFKAQTYLRIFCPRSPKLE